GSAATMRGLLPPGRGRPAPCLPLIVDADVQVRYAGARPSLMEALETLDLSSWDAVAGSAERAAALGALEHGRVVFLPKLAFVLNEGERTLLSPRWSTGRSKNISYDPRSGDVGGTTAAGGDRQALRDLLARYAAATRQLLEGPVPPHRAPPVPAPAR